MNDFNITNVRFLGVNQRPQLDSHVINLEYFNDKLDESTILRLNDDSNERYLQARVGNTAYNLQIYNKTQIIDVTEIISPNTGHDLLYKWAIKCNDRNGGGKIQDFIKSTKTKSATGGSGPETIPPIGNSFMYIETSSNNHNSTNDDVWVSWERTDIIHISNITFYYNRFSINNESLRNMGRLDIQLLRNGSWENFYAIEKNTDFSIDATTWKLLNLDITVQPNYGIKLLYSGLNTAHGDMGFSNISITHSIF